MKIDFLGEAVASVGFNRGVIENLFSLSCKNGFKHFINLVSKDQINLGRKRPFFSSFYACGDNGEGL